MSKIKIFYKKIKFIKIQVLSIFVLLIFPVKNSYGNIELSFPKIWEIIVRASPENKYITLLKESAEKGVERQSRYWLPSFYLNTQVISTNDPTLTFINYLGQGQVKQDDFIPSQLNSPSNNVFNTTQVGLDFILYDGSSRLAYLNSKQHQAKALDYQKNSELIHLYVRVLREYIKIIHTESINNELNVIQKSITEIISNYRIGEKTNPVGYSGYLSLKSILNNIDILNKGYLSNIKNAKIALSSMAGIEKYDWVVSQIELERFIFLYFHKPDLIEKSYQYHVEIENAEAIRENIAAEKAKYLPKVGVFSQANVFGGERDINPSYVFGVYLKVNLSPSDFGSASEVELLSMAKQEAARQIDISQKIMGQTAQENISSTRNKLELISKNNELLTEQIKVLTRLFRNGSASANQIAEIYNKKIELLSNKYTLINFLIESDLAKVYLTRKSVDPKDIWSIK